MASVIFVSMDTLRADRLSCLKYPRGLTPNLDRIAAEGSLFTKAFASDIPTQPSHTNVFTGRFGISTGIVSHYYPWSELDENVAWLPSMFREKGYSTGAVDHLFSMKDWFVRGYEDYLSPPGRSRSPGSVINEMAFPWLETKRKDDVFLFLHYWDPHIPYVPPSPFKERYTATSSKWTDTLMLPRLRSRPSYPLFRRNLYDHLDAKPNLEYIADLYDAEVAYLDHEIHRLFNHLADLNMLDDTLVVLFGDHGENMSEHDAWFDHAGLYDSVVHVPLIIWGPTLVPQSRVDSMVQLVDVMPTVIDLLGMSEVEGLDGRSLLPVMMGETATHRGVVHLSECTWQAKRGVRTEDWKFIRCIDPGVFTRCEDELYDLHADPNEQCSVAAEHPEVVAELGATLTAWLDGHLQGRPDPLLEVVATGLPAVRRLDTLLSEGQLEPHQLVQDTDKQAVVAAGTSLVTTGSPTTATMAPGASTGVSAGGAPPERKKVNRRRAAILAATAVLGVLALIFAINSTFKGDVQASGVLRPAESVDLNFASTGPIRSLSVHPGLRVHAGEILATQGDGAEGQELVAPFAGIVTAVDGTIGGLDGPNGVQQTAPQTQGIPFITVESRVMDVVAQVGEGDIARIHVGEGAQVTFPADPGHTYSAKVVTIDPMAVTQSGNVYFLTKLQLVSAHGHAIAEPGSVSGLDGLSAQVSFG